MDAVWKLAINASWGSFLFGYNIGVFTSCQPCVSATLGWGQNEELFVTIMSALMPFGAMFGSLLSGLIAKKLGRRKALMITDIVIICGSALIVIPHTALFGIGRFLTGYCAGSFACLTPLYINEIAPSDVSGKVGGIVQFQITFGIVVAYAMALVLPTDDYDTNPRNYFWMAMFLFQTIFAAIQFFFYMTRYRNETAKWLVEKGKLDLAMESLREVYNEDEANRIIRRLEEANKRSVIEIGVTQLELEDVEPTYTELLFCKNRLEKMVRLGYLMNIFQQFSGINAILTFSTMIFNDIAADTFMARVYTLIVGIVNMTSTLALFPLIDKIGRKKLIIFGGLGMTICLFFMGFFSDILSSAGPAPSIIFTMIFIIMFEISIGPVCWIYCGEILAIRAMSMCTFVNWFSAFVVVLTFPYIIDATTISGTFFIYAGLNLIGVIYFFFDMIETKGLDKPAIRKLLLRRVVSS